MILGLISAELPVADAPFIHGAGPEVFHHHVGAFHQFPKEVFAFIHADVNADVVLIPGFLQTAHGHPFKKLGKGSQGPHGVPGAGKLHLEDRGTQFRQVAGERRTQDQGAELNDLDVCQSFRFFKRF